MIGAMNQALHGLQTNRQRFEEHAARISRSGASGPVDPPDLPTELVGARTAQRGYEANLAVLRGSDELIGSLLDVLA